VPEHLIADETIWQAWNRGSNMHHWRPRWLSATRWKENIQLHALGGRVAGVRFLAGGALASSIAVIVVIGQHNDLSTLLPLHLHLVLLLLLGVAISECDMAPLQARQQGIAGHFGVHVSVCKEVCVLSLVVDAGAILLLDWALIPRQMLERQSRP
jgi:hypothetical protein